MKEKTATQSISRTRFSMVPIELAEACADRKSWLFVYIWLWHYAGKDDQAFPSVERLAAECHMASRDVRRALTWLTRAGWIKRIERPGRTSLFHVRTERTVSKRSHPKPSQATPPPNGGYPKKDRPQRDTPPPNGPGVDSPTPPPNGVPLPQMGDTPNGPPNKKEIKPRNKTNPLSSSLRSEDIPHGGTLPAGRGQAVQNSGRTPQPSTDQDTTSDPSRSRSKAAQPLAGCADTTDPLSGPSTGRRAPSKAAATLPDFAEPVRAQLEAWWKLRKQRHRAAAGATLTSRSVNALAYAHGLGVLVAFADLAAESGWLSLGFDGHRSLIDRLASEQSQDDCADHPGTCMVRRSAGRSPALRPTSRQSDAAERAIAIFATSSVSQCSPHPISSISLPA